VISAWRRTARRRSACMRLMHARFGFQQRLLQRLGPTWGVRGWAAPTALAGGRLQPARLPPVPGYTPRAAGMRPSAPSLIHTSHYRSGSPRPTLRLRARPGPVAAQARPIQPGSSYPAKELCSHCGLCDTYYIAHVKSACAFLGDGARGEWMATGVGMGSGRGEDVDMSAQPAPPFATRPMRASTTPPNPIHPTQPNPTQPNPTQPNPTQPNPTQPNPTQPNPTQP
jgi:hypothetical protein